jgi:membrane protein DedA with SNARE-associated domain
VVFVGGLLVAPLALYLASRWVAAPAAAPESSGVRQALRRSSNLTRDHRPTTAILTTVVVVTTLVTGPLVGALLLVLSDRSFAFVNLVAAAVSAFLLPWLGIVVTMIHGDLVSRG